MRVSRSLWILAATVVLSGHITDKTTGQPLPEVRVVADGPHHAHAAATSNAEGAYRLRNLQPGRYILTLSSNDVLPQRFEVTVGAKTRTFDIVACSTTLDYSCAGSF